MNFPAPEQPCPYCGFKNNAVAGPDADPAPGDVAICANCIQPSLFGDDLKLRKPTEKEAADLAKDPEMRSAAYACQITSMIMKGKRWVKEHPGADVKIQFNVSPRVFLVQSISEAVKNHAVSANPTGLELLKALWPWDSIKKPTVNMIRMAVDQIIK